jgi:hypothetical protein
VLDAPEPFGIHVRHGARCIVRTVRIAHGAFDGLRFLLAGAPKSGCLAPNVTTPHQPNAVIWHVSIRLLRSYPLRWHTTSPTLLRVWAVPAADTGGLGRRYLPNHDHAPDR